MYVALKALKTSEGQRQAGDKLPEVNEWRPQVVQAHINMKAIGWEGDGHPPHMGAKPTKSVVQAALVKPKKKKIKQQKIKKNTGEQKQPEA